ncbi:hypothetical protein TSPI_07665 [Trichinella spiralis]|uniref:Uncharacterized protein n=2 Tax=Trichinella spiralis TaxID=6334 RepID=A0A0V1B9Y5_TRISP|nr:hypothetical protein T01_9336 [Trichinella spiralis]
MVNWLKHGFYLPSTEVQTGCVWQMFVDVGYDCIKLSQGKGNFNRSSSLRHCHHQLSEMHDKSLRCAKSDLVFFLFMLLADNDDYTSVKGTNLRSNRVVKLM